MNLNLRDFLWCAAATAQSIILYHVERYLWPTAGPTLAEPTTLTIIAVAASVVGAAVAAYGQIQQGEAAASAAKYNARVAEGNARAARDQGEFDSQVASNDAQIARNAAKIKEDNLRRQGAQVQSEGLALTSAAGVESDAGSPLLVAMNNAREIEIAARREQYAGDLEANAALSRGAAARYTGNLQASGFESQARLQRFSGRIAQQSAFTGAGTTLLTGIGSAATIYGRVSGGAPIRVPTSGIQSA